MLKIVHPIAVGGIVLATFFLTGGSNDGLIGVIGGGLSAFASFAIDALKSES
jgi:hypothetical protein